MTIDTEALDIELIEALNKIDELGDEPVDEVDETPPVDEPVADDKAAEDEPPVDDKAKKDEPPVADKDKKADKPAAKNDVSAAAKTLAAAKKAAKTGVEEPVAEDTKMLLPPGPDGQPREVDTKVAPSSWRKDAGAKFAELPREVREEIHKREDDMHRGLSQYKSAADYAAAVAGEFEPYRAHMRSSGINEIGVIRELMGTAFTLRTGTAEARAQLMLDIGKQYGVDWNLAAQLAKNQQAGGAPPQPVADPRVNDLLQREHAREQDEQRRLLANAATEWTTFQSDPKNEFIPIVKDAMADLIEKGLANDLRDAYDKAIWANPAVRAKLVARQAEVDRTQAAERAAAARKVSRGNVARRANPAAGAAPKSTLDDQLSDAYDKLLTS